MKVRYFVLDGRGQLRKVSQAAVRGLWEGRLRAADLGGAGGRELRLVSVFCDRDLLPGRVYLLRLPLAEGAFTLECRLTLAAFARQDCVTPAERVRHHAAGWPADLFRQLAVALDVPLARLAVPVGVGGPLLLAAKLGLTPRQALCHLR